MPSLSDAIVTDALRREGLSGWKANSEAAVQAGFDVDGQPVLFYIPLDAKVTEHALVSLEASLEPYIRQHGGERLVIIDQHDHPSETLQAYRNWDFPYPCRIITATQLRRLAAPDDQAALQIPADELEEAEAPLHFDDLQQGLSSLKTKLLDLTLRNPLLNFRTGINNSIPITDELPSQVLHLLVYKSREMVLDPMAAEDLAAMRKRQLTVNEDDVTDNTPQLALELFTEEESGAHEAPTDPGTASELADHLTDDHLQTALTPRVIDGRLNGVRRNHETLIDSTGTNLLYIALGFLHWYESTDAEKVRKAPLVLIPVHIDRHKVEAEEPISPQDDDYDPDGPAYQTRVVTRYEWTLRHDGNDVTTNQTLAHKLASFGISLPAEADAQLEDGKGHATFDVEAYFKAVTRSLSGLKDDNRWKVRREIYLGFFSFAKIQMYRDMEALSQPGATLPVGTAIVDQVFGGTEADRGEIPPYEAVERAQQSSEYPLVLDADSSQTKAIILAMQGRNLVVEGPPGTGKSQTIANMIATALSAGKRVLFVSEKSAALEVVQDKLTDVDLGAFILNLHSHKASPKVVLSSIQERLDLRPRRGTAYSKALSETNALRDTLNAYAEAVADKAGPLGESVADIFWIACDAASAVAEHLPEGISRAKVLVPDEQARNGEFLVQARQLLDEFSAYLNDGTHTRTAAWRGYPVHLLSTTACDEILAAVRQQRDALQQILDAEVAELGGSPFAEEYMASRVDGCGTITTNPPQPPEPFIPDLAKAMRQPGARSVLGPVLEQCQQIAQAEADLAGALDALPTGQALSDLLQAIIHCHSVGLQEAGEAEISRLSQHLGMLIPALEAGAAAVAPALGRLSMPATPDQAAIPQCHAAILTLVRCAMGTLRATPATLDSRFLSISLSPALEQAHQQRDDLETEYQDLEADLVLADTPEDVELRELRQILNERPGAWCAWLGIGRLAKARKRVRRFSRHKNLAKLPQIVDRLDQVVAWRAKASAFTEDQDLRVRIGPMFDGLNTPWPQLDDAVAATQALGTLVERAKAKQLIDEGQLGSLEELDLSLIEDSLVTYAAAAEAMDQAWQSVVRQPLPGGAETAGGALRELQQLQAAFQLILDFYHQCPASLRIWSLQTLLSKLKLASTRTELLAKIGADEQAQALLPGHLDPAALPLRPLINSWSWTTEVLDRPDLNAVADWLLADPTAHFAALQRYLTVFKQAFSSFADAADRLGKHGKIEPNSAWSPTANLTIPTAIQRLDAALVDGAVLTDWSRLCVANARARTLGLNAIVDCTLEHDLPSSSLLNALHADVYERVAIHVLGSADALRTFQRQQHDRRREHFLVQDAKLADHARDAIVDRLCTTTVPNGVRGRYVSDHTELQLIKHELGKQRMHIPIRQLIHRAPNALAALKPLWMMSPLSVAYYVPLHNVEFDIVLMDEASQIRPEDAMGAMFRAKQVIVVGDSKQMPPTNFFNATQDEDGEDEALAIQETESILGACRDAFQPVQLQWHYRSKHESLIAFSNRQYYNDTLDVFPSKIAEASHLGIHFVKVEDGTFEGGRNRIEAERVVEAIFAHARDCRRLVQSRRPSLGVATMNLKQRELILDLLEQRTLESAEHDELYTLLMSLEDPLFVKNLENIQGDERDHIIISCTYGKDKASGVVPQRFGPIAQSGGERRLNVLFTRARQKVTVYSSMEPEDLKPTPATKQGVHDFKAYLLFAKTKCFIDRGIDLKAQPESPFEVEVARVIQSMGLETRYQIGVAKYRIDIAIVNPAATGEYLMGIECDGATYHSSRCARDRDRLRETVLRSRGWKIYRIWSTDWFQNRAVEIERLREAIAERLADPTPQFTEYIEARSAGAEAEPVPSAGTAPEPDRVAARRVPSISGAPTTTVVQPEPQSRTVAPNIQLEPYQIFEGGSFPDPREATKEAIVEGLLKVIAVEGPMITKRAYDVYLRAAGIRRMGKEIRKIMNQAMYVAVRSKQVEVNDELNHGGYMLATARLPSTPAVRVRSRGPRTIDQIPASELRAIGQAIIEASPGLKPGGEPHLRAILEHYELKQLTQHTQEVLSAALGGIE